MKKKYRIRKGSIADRIVTLSNRIETEPFATITFFLVMMAATALFVATINSEYPIS